MVARAFRKAAVDVTFSGGDCRRLFACGLRQGRDRHGLADGRHRPARVNGDAGTGGGDHGGALVRHQCLAGPGGRRTTRIFAAVVAAAGRRVHRHRRRGDDPAARQWRASDAFGSAWCSPPMPCSACSRSNLPCRRAREAGSALRPVSRPASSRWRLACLPFPVCLTSRRCASSVTRWCRGLACPSPSPPSRSAARTLLSRRAQPVACVAGGGGAGGGVARHAARTICARQARAGDLPPVVFHRPPAARRAAGASRADVID